jgi:hypothetical protein
MQGATVTSLTKQVNIRTILLIDGDFARLPFLTSTTLGLWGSCE